MRTSIRSPSQNGVAERWLGSVRRELFDHIIPLNEYHLRRLGRDYLLTTTQSEHTLALNKSTPPNEPSKDVLTFKPESSPYPGWAVFTIVTVGRKRRETNVNHF